MGRKAARQLTQAETRTPIPTIASLTVSPERLERMWQMTAQQRVEAAQQGARRDGPVTTRRACGQRASRQR